MKSIDDLAGKIILGQKFTGRQKDFVRRIFLAENLNYFIQESTENGYLNLQKSLLEILNLSSLEMATAFLK